MKRGAISRSFSAGVGGTSSKAVPYPMILAAEPDFLAHPKVSSVNSLVVVKSLFHFQVHDRLPGPGVACAFAVRPPPGT